MEDGSSDTGDTSDCTAADVTDGSHVKQNEEMEDEIEVPPLTRTDSVFLTKEMLEYSSLSISTSSEDEYVPASSEASSDESSERSSQKQRPKTSSKSENGSDRLSGAKKKKRGREASVHSREQDSDEPKLKTKKRYNRSDKRCSSSSEEEESGESRLKKSEKRGMISRVEGEPDDSASIKRKKSRKIYTRYKKCTISISVKSSDSDSQVIADVPEVDECKKYHQKRKYCICCWEPMEESSGESSEDEDHPAAPAGEEPMTRDEQGTSEQQPVEEQSSGGEEPMTRDEQGSSEQQPVEEQSSGGEESVTRDEQGTSEQQPVEEQSSGEEESVTRQKKGTSKQQLGQKQISRGAKNAKRKWSTEEVKAVEKSLMDFIRMGKTPGKQACERCIAASPEALADRDWRGVKFYVHNRIRTWPGIPHLSPSSVTTATTASITMTRCTLGHLAVIEQRDAAVKRFEQTFRSELSRSDDDKRRRLSELHTWNTHWRQQIHTLTHTL